MAGIVAGLGTSHVPAIGVAIDMGKTQEPYWKPLFDGYEPARQQSHAERVRAALDDGPRRGREGCRGRRPAPLDGWGRRGNHPGRLPDADVSPGN